MLSPLFLGRMDYATCYSAMQQFTQHRGLQSSPDVHDELWICEHNAVFTQGVGGRPEHLLHPSEVRHIPVIQTDRGGQITYHGPGQVVAYPLLDLRSTGYLVRGLVYRLEQSVIDTLLHFGVTGHRVTGAPGVYVRLDDPFGHRMPTTGGDRPSLALSASAPDWTGLGKIAALGLKVSHHCTYHGVALNVAMDLAPFAHIRPCGQVGLQVIDLAALGVVAGWADVAAVLGQKLCTGLAL